MSSAIADFVLATAYFETGIQLTDDSRLSLTAVIKRLDRSDRFECEYHIGDLGIEGSFEVDGNLIDVAPELFWRVKDILREFQDRKV